MRKLLLAAATLLISLSLSAQRTLRVDYSFCGGAGSTDIYVDALSDAGPWFGRRCNLKDIPVEGNGSITLTDAASGEVLYRNSFSTLFQEWLNTEEAVSERRSFENVFLVPMPEGKATVTVELYNAARKKIASLSHDVDPAEILIRRGGALKCPRETRELLHSGSPEEKIDVVIVAEGYTAAEAETFYRQAQEGMEAIFSHEPFATRRGCFNFTAVMLESQDSGVSEPKKGEWKNTPLGSTYDTFHMDRYLTTLHLKTLHDCLEGIPYEHIIIIANTDTYGGGGIYNSYTLTTAGHPLYPQIIAHEFGHSFGALGDEYAYDDMYSSWYPAGVEPWEQNITTKVDFASKWEDMMGTEAPNKDAQPFKVGLYEGAGYQTKGAYRPVDGCLMRILWDKERHYTTFCPVCVRAIDRLIDFNCGGANPSKVAGTLDFKMLPGEKWWGGIDHFKKDMDGLKFTLPLDAGSRVYLDMKQNYTNQAVPFFLSSRGRYIWSDEPFEIWFEGGSIRAKGAKDLQLVTAGETLREAFQDACAKHFPPSGQIPVERFIASPQYNTFIEMRTPTQEGVLNYARNIIANGFPSGAVLMIDAGWVKYLGNFEPDKDKFPDMKAMCDTLHGLGFKVMLWVVPFVSPDSREYGQLKKKGYFVKEKNSEEPYITKWWSGRSAVFDMSNPEARAYYISELRKVQEKYGVDGFKFDAGDYYSYKESDVRVFDGVSYDSRHAQKWGELYKDFPYHEFRACWKLAGQPVIQRLQDKDYSWDGVGLLLPSMLSSSMEGHQFVCPDMIGGGQYSSFVGIDEDKFDQELIVRSCQIHAVMPMMQFSVAPWRILSKENMDICRAAAELHVELAPYLLEQARKCSLSGEPIIRPMDYAFPGEGFEGCLDQYMLGEDLLVAPMTVPGTVREVKLPRGKWADETGKIYKGGKTYKITVPLNRIPRFVLYATESRKVRK